MWGFLVVAVDSELQEHVFKDHQYLSVLDILRRRAVEKVNSFPFLLFQFIFIMNFHSWNLKHKDLFLKEWHPNKNQNMWFKQMINEKIIVVGGSLIPKS